ncbi:MAG TPA: hypothetical protein VKU37_11725 [Verrucomicrobiae bacterium]|nr:hypothetical protein [Verrucomicrobiae bacterium]
MRLGLYADGIKEGAPVRLEMTCLRPPADKAGGHIYTATVPSTLPPTDYTVRVMPRCDGAAIPLEAPRILWQR